MGILDSLNKANTNWAGNATVKMNLGDGNTKVDIETGNAELLFGFCDHDIDVITTCGDAHIATMCGDNEIDVNSAGSASVKTGCCGEDAINITAEGNAVAITGDSDDTVTIDAGGFAYVDTASKDKDSELTDNDTVSVKADGNTAYYCSYKKLMCDKFDTEVNSNYINLGDGNDTADVFADYVKVNKGKGTMLLGAIGSNYAITSKADKNTIGAYGDNYSFSLRGNADNDVRTMDYWIRDGKDGKTMETENGDMSLKDTVDDVNNVDGYTLTEYDAKNNTKAVQFFKDKFSTYFDNMTKVDDEVGNLLSTEVEALEGMTVDEIAEAYGLSTADATALKNIDRTAMFDEETPLYALVETEKTECECSSTKYTLVKITSKDDEKVTAETVNGGESMELTLQDVACGCGCPCCDCVAEPASHTQADNLEGKEQTTGTYELFQKWTTEGVTNWTIRLSDTTETEETDDDDSCCKCPCKEKETEEEQETEVLGKGKLMAYISARADETKTEDENPYDIKILGQDVNYDENMVNIKVTGSHTDKTTTTTQKQSALDWAMAIFNKKEQVEEKPCGSCGESNCKSCG